MNNNSNSSKQKKALVLFANVFPYGTGETYLETEINYYGLFDKIYIVALCIKKEDSKTIREVGENIEVIPVFRKPSFLYVLSLIPALIDKNIYFEFGRLVKSGKFGIFNLCRMFVYFSRARIESKEISKALKGKVNSKTLFYSYRFDYQPYTALLVRNRLNLHNQIISRAHGYDLYENVAKHGYIPMREELLGNLSAVFPCSDHGTKYLKGLFPKQAKKVSTRYLGTYDYGVHYYNNTGVYTIVSCSNLVPVKRISLLIDALSLLNDKQIKWIHYGDGVLMNELKQRAKNKLKIEFEFKGKVSNSRILKDYSLNDYYLFVNVSSSEGLPVSIMEAISFGIPCIATDVGGTREIIIDGENGVLLPANVTARMIAKEIQRFLLMNTKDYYMYRDKAREIWSKSFNSNKNYSSFANELYHIE